VCAGAVGEMKAEVEGLCMAISDKSSQHDQLEAELGEKTAELSKLKQEVVLLEEQLEVGSQTVKKLEVQQKASTVLINQQKASIMAASEEKLHLEKVVSEYKEKAEWLSAENNKLETSKEMLDAQHRNVVQQLMVSRDSLAAENRDLSLHLAAQSETSGPLDVDSIRIDSSKSKPVEVSLSDSSCLQPSAAVDSASDESKQVECDLVLSHAKVEQSSDTDGELIVCREEVQHLQSLMMEREKAYTTHLAQLSAELQSCRLSRLDNCTNCISKDRLISDLNNKTRSLEDNQQQLVRELESCREEFGDEKRRLQAEINQLDQQVEELATKLQHADEELATHPADDVVAALRAEIESLKVDLDEKDSFCQLYESQVDQLTKEIQRQHEIINKFPQKVDSGVSSDEMSTLKDKLRARDDELKKVEEENCRLRQKVGEMSTNVEQLQQKLLNSAAAAASHDAQTCSDNKVPVDSGPSEIDLNVAEDSTGMNRTASQNGDTCCQSNGHVQSNSKEIAQLRSTICQQKEMLNALNAKYASVHGLLEDRSQSQHGSSLLCDFHRLEVELHEVRLDRERLLAVLSENSREASTLRAEVHRLTSVAAASQAALTKAQRDAQQMAMQAHQETNQDMKNEAVKKLSQMIKDKDVEIDALQLKNATLVQVCCQVQQRMGTHTHTHPFNGPLSRTTWVSRYQKGKTNLDCTEAIDSEWQWH